MMARSLTASGLSCQPLSVRSAIENRAVDRDTFKPHRTLAQNVKALMAHREGPTTQGELHRRSGVAQATIGRVLKGDQTARVETVAMIARAYSLEPWQLLVPGMDPSNPPTIRAASKEEQALYDRLKQAAQDLAKLGK